MMIMMSTCSWCTRLCNDYYFEFNISAEYRNTVN